MDSSRVGLALVESTDMADIVVAVADIVVDVAVVAVVGVESETPCGGANQWDLRMQLPCFVVLLEEVSEL